MKTARALPVTGLLLAAAVALAIAACAPGQPGTPGGEDPGTQPAPVVVPEELRMRPDDFALEYRWAEGSVPPPYHYEYVIRLEPSGEGQVVMWPDYPREGVPEWTESFSLSADELDALYETMVSEGLLTEEWTESDEPSVGGPTSSLEATAHGRQVEMPDSLETGVQMSRAAAIAEALRASVPEAIWSDLEARREAYVAAQGSGTTE